MTAHLQGLTDDHLDAYLRNTYQLVSVAGLSIDTIYAVEVEPGNIKKPELSSFPVRTWEIRGENCRLTSNVLDMSPCNAAADAGLLWPHPIITFFADEGFVLTRETIGITRVTPYGDRVLTRALPATLR